MKSKAVQYFSDEYLEQCRKMSGKEIVEFLEGFRELHGGSPTSSKSKLISMKVPEDLLGTFRKKCELNGIPYQTQVKRLMADWLKRS
jgi:hypothetical protein